MVDRRLLAIPTSCRRVAAYNLNWGWVLELAHPCEIAILCPVHCSTCVAQGIRGMMTWRHPHLPPAYHRTLIIFSMHVCRGFFVCSPWFSSLRWKVIVYFNFHFCNLDNFHFCNLDCGMKFNASGFKNSTKFGILPCLNSEEKKDQLLVDIANGVLQIFITFLNWWN